MSDILVLGIGNTLLTDDGAGVHAATLLGRELPESAPVTVLDAGTLSFSLLPQIEQCASLIVFDAARGGAAPGAVEVRAGAAMDAWVRRDGRSVHEVGLSDVLDMARLSGCLPSRRVLIGIEPDVVDWGLDPTPEVARALPRAVAAAREIIDLWCAEAAAAPAHAAELRRAV